MATLRVWNSELQDGTSMGISKTSFASTYLDSLHKGKTWKLEKGNLKCAITPIPEYWCESYEHVPRTSNISFTDNLGVTRKPVDHRSGIEFYRGRYRFFNTDRGKQVLLEQARTKRHFNGNWAHNTGWGSNSGTDDTDWTLRLHHFLLLKATDSNWHDLYWRDESSGSGELDWVGGGDGTGYINIYEDPVLDGGTNFSASAKSYWYSYAGWTSYHWSVWSASGTAYRPKIEGYYTEDENYSGDTYDHIIRSQHLGSRRVMVAASYICKEGYMKVTSDTDYLSGTAEISGTHYKYITYGNWRNNTTSLDFNYVMYF